MYRAMLIKKQVYIFQCKFFVIKKQVYTFLYKYVYTLIGAGLLGKLKICIVSIRLHFNWCGPAGKIENMHWQCRSPKGTLHCQYSNLDFNLRISSQCKVYFYPKIWKPNCYIHFWRIFPSKIICISFSSKSLTKKRIRRACTICFG